MRNVTSLIPAQPASTKMIALGMGRKELITTAGQVNCGLPAARDPCAWPTRLLPGMAMMNRSPQSRPAHQYKGSNLISPGIAASSTRASVPSPGPGERGGRDDRFGAAVEHYGDDRVSADQRDPQRQQGPVGHAAEHDAQPAEDVGGPRLPEPGQPRIVHAPAFSGRIPPRPLAFRGLGRIPVSGTLTRQPPHVGAPLSGGYQDHARNHSAPRHSVAAAPAWHDGPIAWARARLGARPRGIGRRCLVRQRKPLRRPAGGGMPVGKTASG